MDRRDSRSSEPLSQKRLHWFHSIPIILPGMRLSRHEEDSLFSESATRSVSGALVPRSLVSNGGFQTPFVAFDSSMVPPGRGFGGWDDRGTKVRGSEVLLLPLKDRKTPGFFDHPRPWTGPSGGQVRSPSQVPRYPLLPPEISFNRESTLERVALPISSLTTNGFHPQTDRFPTVVTPSGDSGPRDERTHRRGPS